VVIHDLHLKRITVPPNKARAVLIVDANAVLTGAATLQRFQAVPREDR
jgi:hypothetical protein